MPLISKPNYNQIFASQAPEQDKPAVFNNYPLGWGVESRPNNGKPTIKGFNYLQQTSDLKDLWILQNGACLPYDESIEYAEGAPVLKDGVIQYKTAGGFSPAISEVPYILKYFTEGASYPLNARVMLDSGDIVKSTVANNTTDPNVDMTGWLFVTKNKADTVISIDALRGFYPEYNGQLVETVSYHAFTNTGASRYRWNPSGDSLDDGFARIRTSKASGCFEIIEQDEYSLSQLGAQPNQIIDNYISTFISSATTYTFSRNLVVDSGNYEATENLSNYTNLLRIRGLGAQSRLKYVGSDGGVLVKAVNGAGTTNALSTVGLSDIAIDMNFVEGATALQVIYATNESRFKNIQISNIGINGCGVDTSKLWYTFFDNIRVSNPSAVKQGIGLKVRSIAGDATSQVNGISYNGFRIGGMDIGFLFDSISAAHYSLQLNGVIEGCNVAVKHIGTLGVVRMDTFIHYEKNVINIEWGVAGQGVSTTGLISWNGYSNGGDFRFNQNDHDVKIRTVPTNATVYMTGTARVAWLGQATANLDQVNYPDTAIPLIDFKDKTITIGRKESTQIYATPEAAYGKIISHSYLHTSGSSTTTDINDFVRVLSNKTFTKVEFICVRPSDGADRQFSGIVIRRSGGVWRMSKLAGNDFDTTFTLAIDNNGIITHTGNYELEVFVLITPC